ncbi:DMT family transporter [Alteromonas sediminis]|uniref:DMT family transporter n=1 Tax=Alteromonas sediminis TaxID=2259342 RepID=A0A3N5YDC2_9ALTE|nr:DMT family transporter [Alteromonas sediminis]RPJ67535.1 DMT family transporter [Alteromonas sediminis]
MSTHPNQPETLQTNHYAKGLILSLTTAVMWGVLPLFLILCLKQMDSSTITFYRFVFAGVVVLFILIAQRRLKPVLHMPIKWRSMLFFTTFLLVLNYVTNVLGLVYLSPGSVQILMQIAPFALMAGGVFFFKESLTKTQKTGIVVLITGLMLFFQQRLPDILTSDKEQPIGIVIIAFSALVWASYALLQKNLLKQYSANQLNVFLYLVGALMLLPFSELGSVSELSVGLLLALLFCCINTLVAYGAFTEALRVWDASRVSAVLSTTPLFTFIFSEIADAIWPALFYVPNVSAMAYVGAGLVMLGSMICALGKRTPKAV